MPPEFLVVVPVCFDAYYVASLFESPSMYRNNVARKSKQQKQWVDHADQRRNPSFGGNADYCVRGTMAKNRLRLSVCWCPRGLLIFLAQS